MGIGGGIALIVVGAILAFAVRDQFDAIDLTMIGYICMGAGLVTIILGLVMQSSGRRSTRTVVQESAPGQVITREDRTDPPPPMV